MKTVLQYIIYISLIYAYVNNPILSPLGGIGVVKLLYLFSGAVILASVVFYNKNIGYVKKELRFLILANVYIVLRTLFGPDNQNYLYTGVVQIIEEIFVPVAIVTYLLKHNLGRSDFIRVLLMVASIGGLISSVCLFIPSVNEYVRNTVVIIEKDSYLAENLFRGFGISDGLTFSYGIIQGFLFSLGLLHLKDNKWFIVFMPTVALSVLVNARTGFLIIIVGILLYAFFNGAFKVLTVAMLSVVIISYFLPWALTMIGDETASWMQEFFNEIVAVFDRSKGSESSTAAALFGRMAIFPEGIWQWLFGRGVYLFGQKSGNNTDVGWFLQLNLGGLIYMYLLFEFVKCVIGKLKLCGTELSTILLILITVLISNTKGDFLNNSGGVRLILLVIFFYYLSSRVRLESN